MKWQGDGIIARIENEELADFISECDLPTVDLRYRYRLPGVPTIENDEASIIELACAHLFECGLKNFAYCGFEGANFSLTRQKLAQEQCARHGHELQVFNSKAGVARDTVEIEGQGLVHGRELTDWLISLPKPTGLLACNDIRGAQILNVCREIGIAVPDEIAVLGIDDDRLICELTTPPMSSVKLNAFRIGYVAGETLTQMIEGNAPPEERIFVEAQGVVGRQSTNLLAIADQGAASALRFIRSNACKRISVEDVAAQVRMSRSTLDRRFSRATGTTVKAEITRIRIERIKQLLVDTDYSLARIAGLVGFEHVEYLSTMFKQHTGQTPGQYRKMHQSLTYPGD